LRNTAASEIRGFPPAAKPCAAGFVNYADNDHRHVGAHALERGYRLLTLDDRLDQAAFPALKIVSI
jgi:hypothetical protein